MRFIADPNRFVFFIGLAVLGSTFILAYLLLSRILLLIPALLVWIIISVYLAKRNYAEFFISENKFVISFAGKKYNLDFADVDYIIETSSYTNFFREKRYVLKLKDNVNIHSRALNIENKAFSKWILEHKDTFAIKKQMTFD